MFDTLESTTDEYTAIKSVQELIFDSPHSEQSIVGGLNIVEKYFDPLLLIDEAAKRELPTLYTHHRQQKHEHSITMPNILLDWQGDFRDDTEKLYEIIRGETENELVSQYQKQMREQLPPNIPLVRGGSTSHDQAVRSWTASVQTAQLYDSNLSYTVANPEDVFMCSLYGEHIGEQEFTLTDWDVQETYSYSLENTIRIYRQMKSDL